jgi:hypothetical protein
MITCWYCDHERKSDESPCLHCGNSVKLKQLYTQEIVTRSLDIENLRNRVIEEFKKEPGQYRSPYLMAIACSLKVSSVALKEIFEKLYDEGLLLKSPHNPNIYKLIPDGH